MSSASFFISLSHPAFRRDCAVLLLNFLVQLLALGSNYLLSTLATPGIIVIDVPPTCSVHSCDLGRVEVKLGQVSDRFPVSTIRRTFALMGCSSQDIANACVEAKVLPSLLIYHLLAAIILVM